MAELGAQDANPRSGGGRPSEPENTLPSPEELDLLFTKYSALMGMAPLPPVFLYTWCTMQLTLEHFRFLGMAAIIALVLGIGVGTILRKRGGGEQDKILDYLRHRQEGTVTPEMRAESFTATMALPHMLFNVTFYSWCVPFPIVGLVLFLRFDDISMLSAICWSFGGIAGAALSTVPSFSIWKKFLEPVRETIAAEFEHAHERAPLIPKIPLVKKFMYPVMGLVLTAFLFGITLSEVRANRSTERTFLDLQEQTLLEFTDSLEDGDVDLLDSLAESSEKWSGARIALAILDSEEPAIVIGEPNVITPGEIRLLLREAEENPAGNSAGIDSHNYFSWQPLSTPGRFIVAATRPQYDLSSLWLNLLVISTALIAAAIAALYGSRDFVHDINVMHAQVHRMIDGDLTPGRAFDSEDELGDLARGIQTLGETLRETVGEVVGAAERVDEAAGHFSEAGQNVAQVTLDQVRGIHQVSNAIDSVTSQINDLAESSQDLSQVVSESASSVLELKTTAQGLTETAADLSDKAQQTSTSIEQSLHSIGEISQNTETLAGSAGEAASSMDEMAKSVQEVDANANEGAQLSGLVVDAADQGRERVEQTIEGMKAIAESTEMAEQVIRTLSKRTEEIGEFTDVITHVADETNLLALNAAIIAAQAGTHGRPFAVVADEIKNLADNVLSNTKEIAVVIASLQEETSRAVGVVAQGSVAVQSGVELSDEAGRALVEITGAARESGDRMKGIRAAVGEQASSTTQIAELIENVHEELERIRCATHEQHQGGEVILTNAGINKDNSDRVDQAMREQLSNTEHITRSFESVRQTVSLIENALQQQSAACQQVSQFLDGMKSDTETNEQAAEMMKGATEILQEQASDLREKSRRFRI